MSKNNLKKRIRNWLKGNHVLLILMIPFFILGFLPQIAESQIVRKKPPTVSKTPPMVPTKRPIFEGKSIVPGGATDDPLLSKLSRTTLTMEEKQGALMDVMSIRGIKTAVSDTSISTYANLSARTPFIENKTYILYYGQDIFDPASNYFRVSENGFFYVYLKPDKINAIFLIDCEVFVYGTTNQSVPWEIWGPDGNHIDITISGLRGHLQVFLISKNLDWQRFSVRRNKSYVVQGCEIISTGALE